MFVNPYHYTKIIIVCPSVTEGHRKQFDIEQSYAISLATEHLKLKESLSVLAMAQASHRPTGGLYKNRAILDSYMLRATVS